MQELMEALRALGTKLGLAVEELAPYLVEYTRMAALGRALMAIPILMLGCVVARKLVCLAQKMRADTDKDTYTRTKHTQEEEAMGIELGAWLIGFSSVLLAGLVVAYNLPTVLEPTGAIIRDLLRMK